MDEFEGIVEGQRIRRMPNMPPEGEQVVDIFAHRNGAYAVTIPKLSS